MTESHKIPHKSEMERFLLTILLGEFQPEEEQESEAIIIRGLISLIPVVDQILDAQDTIAVIYRVSNKNGTLIEDDYLDLGFTLLGWVPELGSVLKTLGKYARKEKQGVQNGIEMIEKAFGQSPGAFISKLRNLLDDKSRWTSIAEETVSKCQSLLNTYLDFLNIIAQGELVVIDAWGIRGAIDLPDYLVNIAQEQIRSITSFQQQLNGAIHQGVNVVREYLLELLGEHAVLVETSQALAKKTMETGEDIQHGRVAIADKKAESTSLGKSKRKEKSHPILNNGSTAVNAQGVSEGNVAIVIQGTYDNLGHKRSGIVGEHIADYWVWYALGGGYSQHDHAFNTKENNIQGCYKVNAGHQLYQLHTKNANDKGIDSLWKVNRRLGGDKNYCIVDAKSSFTQDKTKSLGALLKDKRPKELRKTQAEIDKLQMSKAWCNKNLKKIDQKKVINQYSRLILFFKQSTIQQHYAAYVKVIEAINNNHSTQKLQQAMDEHRDNHHIDKQFSEQEIQQRIDQMTGNKKDSETQDKNEKKKKQKGRT